MRHKGPWSRDEVERFLEETRVPIRLACNGTARHPVLASLWYLPEDGRLWCATQRAASVATLLARDPHCAFEVSGERPPYRGVRGQGVARLHDDRGEAILRALMERYRVDLESPFATWLLGRVERETAIAIEPQTLVSWDYRRRMGGSV
jgi:nitroimidazol reductase NimA-like FMN-containing flavoprotein (pyridoxamine 5'-phosphate oxidase superfamily)